MYRKKIEGGLRPGPPPDPLTTTLLSRLPSPARTKRFEHAGVDGERRQLQAHALDLPEQELDLLNGQPSEPSHRPPSPS